MPIGPLTNIALAIKTFPEIIDNIKDIFIMGGNHKGKSETHVCPLCEIQFQIIKIAKCIRAGRGNIVAGAEFNFHADPVAAHIVLNTLKCPINILPLECGLPGSLNISVVIRTSLN